MDEVTVISYPGSSDDALLSLTEDRSRYLLPFGGRFRVIDFTVRNSFVADARRTIIFSNVEDNLEEYISTYGDFQNEKFPRIKVVSSSKQDIELLYKLVLDSNTNLYIFYNGTNPSIIDFKNIIHRFRKSRKHAVLYKMRYNGHATLAYTILVVNQKILLNVINRAIDEKQKAPNIFEMIVNIFLNKEIETSVAHVHYWPIRNVLEYYQYHINLIKMKEMFELFYVSSNLKGNIPFEGYARLGPHARVSKSLLADGCDVNGTVIDSVVYPGAIIGEKAFIKGCVILPYASVGPYTRMYHTVLDERTIPGSEFNVGERCYVGTEEQGLKNSDYPNSIFGSISLIGKNCAIPHGARIGGACYVASGKGSNYFVKTKYLYNGMSIVR
ncbi:MAG: hypothetical protein N2316_05750 [Spirochaetes bacterium]|nr:hypothetical protein [Spirochaetota bacterium]